MNFIIIVSILSTFMQINAKIFEKCELARLLKNNYQLPIEQVVNWVCIAQYQSGFNSSFFSGNAEIGTHGIFQISDQFWCSPPGNGWACGVTCDRLRDDDLTDDVACIRKIFEEHQRLSGDGFNAWSVYQPYCKGRAQKTIQDCSIEETPLSIDVRRGTRNYAPPGKVFERCELANSLRNQYQMPLDEVANLVCIAHYQSGLDSSALTGNDIIKSHGIFQISDEFWCSPPGKGLGCGLSCDKLRDGDLSDDILCVRKIRDEHQRISGDGYDAWSTYQPYCKGQAQNMIRDCFSDADFSYSNSNLTNFKIPSNSLESNLISHFEDVDNSLDSFYDPEFGKVYSRCELAQELYYKHKIPKEQIPTWVCIAEHESHFNTSAVGRLNADGSEDHGIFQISDIYWCSPPGQGKGCGLTCDQLKNSDLTDDVECIKKIFNEHQRLSGDGFTAWAVYRPHCQGQLHYYIEGCLDDIIDNTVIDKYVTGSSAVSIIKNVQKSKTGKIYTACELASELRDKHKIPEYEIATWVCIAWHESRFNTSAVGISDHGLFQISHLYWCSTSGRGKGCGLLCNDLEDDDLTDDIQCIRTIYNEHTRLSGDGFNAWVVYQPHCSNGKANKFLENCKSITESSTTIPPRTTTRIPVQQIVTKVTPRIPQRTTTSFTTKFNPKLIPVPTKEPQFQSQTTKGSFSFSKPHQVQHYKTNLITFPKHSQSSSHSTLEIAKRPESQFSFDVRSAFSQTETGSTSYSSGTKKSFTLSVPQFSASSNYSPNINIKSNLQQSQNKNPFSSLTLPMTRKPNPINLSFPKEVNIKFSRPNAPLSSNSQSFIWTTPRPTRSEPISFDPAVIFSKNRRTLSSVPQRISPSSQLERRTIQIVSSGLNPAPNTPTFNNGYVYEKPVPALQRSMPRIHQSQSSSLHRNVFDVYSNLYGISRSNNENHNTSQSPFAPAFPNFTSRRTL